jgi:NH3-dependent NAD+ synthetase
MNGGLAVIGDLYKTSVFALCDWLDSPASRRCREDYSLPDHGELVGDAIDKNPRARNYGLIKKTATRCRTTALSMPYSRI